MHSHTSQAVVVSYLLMIAVSLARHAAVLASSVQALLLLSTVLKVHKGLIKVNMQLRNTDYATIDSGW
jgi:hypothetical protein